jgi:hypothetical protein
VIIAAVGFPADSQQAVANQVGGDLGESRGLDSGHPVFQEQIHHRALEPGIERAREKIHAVDPVHSNFRLEVSRLSIRHNPFSLNEINRLTHQSHPKTL